MFRTVYLSSRGGGDATIAIQLRKVNKGSQVRRILEKMIICFKKMYHVNYIVFCKIPICFKKIPNVSRFVSPPVH